MSFFMLMTCGYIALFVLAMKWPNLMEEWENIAIELPTFRDKKQKSIFVLKIRLLVFVVMILAAGNCFKDRSPFYVKS